MPSRTKRLKSAAFAAIIVFAMKSTLLNNDPYLQLQQGQYTAAVQDVPPDETIEHYTLRVLDRKDKERRMDDNNLQRMQDSNQQMSSGDMNEPFYICDRPADLGERAQFSTSCPGSTNPKKLLLLDGTNTYGRTGNNLIEFLHALQYSRDNDILLGVQYGSWAMRLLPRMWLSITDEPSKWLSEFEKAFCLKVIHRKIELKQYDVIRVDTKDLLLYRSNQSFVQYAAFQQQVLRTLFQNYNRGKGTTLAGLNTRSMCEGIDAIFGKDSSSVIYSVIHLRKLEKVGYAILGAVSKHTGCDPRAAIEMRPDYVRQILKPLKMLNHPIVIIGDNKNFEAMQRLLDDPEIGPNIVFVPKSAVWNGGDMTLAIMSNVFIGNPASSFSGFIAKSRLALGKGHTYLFRARNDEGKWHTVCGDSCVFDNKITHF